MIKVDHYLLRKPNAQDISDLLNLKNDEESAYLLGGEHRKYSRLDIEHWISFHNAQEDELVLVMQDLESGVVFGHLGLYKINLATKTAEFGILIANANFRGKGLGVILTNAFIEYVFENIAIEKIHALVLHENLASIGMFSKCGFIKMQTLLNGKRKNDKDYDIVVMTKER